MRDSLGTNYTGEEQSSSLDLSLSVALVDLQSSAEYIFNTDALSLFSCALEQVQKTIKRVKASHTRCRALCPELIPVYRQSARW